MKTLKLTPLQKIRIEEACRHAARTLSEIKQHNLEAEALQDMKALEAAVQTLEVLRLRPSGR